MHMLIQSDLNEDKWISKKELVGMLGRWFDSMDREKSGKLSKETFIKTLPDAFFPNSRKPLGRIPELYVAQGLFSLADPNEVGIVTKESLTSSFDSLWENSAFSNSGKLNEHSLMIGLRSLIKE